MWYVVTELFKLLWMAIEYYGRWSDREIIEHMSVTNKPLEVSLDSIPFEVMLVI